MASSLKTPYQTFASSFTAKQIDCTTAVVLKILDHKCKMNPADQAALLALYDALPQRLGDLFAAEVHRLIARARRVRDAEGDGLIHELRLFAEANIPKPVMKRFKAMVQAALARAEAA